MEKGFNSHRRNGFHMTFDNGYTISVQWGIGTYSDNHLDMSFDFDKIKPSKTAEIAVLDSNEDLVDFLDDFLPKHLQNNSDGRVCGYATPNDVLYVMKKVAAYKKEN